MGLLEHGVNQSGLAVVNVSDYCDVPDVLSFHNKSRKAAVKCPQTIAYSLRIDKATEMAYHIPTKVLKYGMIFGLEANDV
jgi:hypothetical protein